MKVRLGDELFSQFPMSNGLPEGSDLGPLHILVFINDIPVSFTSHCYIFADDVKLICYTNEVRTLLKDPRQKFRWTLIYNMRFNVVKSQHIHLGPGPVPPLVMPDETATIKPVLLVQQNSYIKLISNFKL